MSAYICQHAVPRNVHKLLCGIIKAKYVLFERKKD